MKRFITKLIFAMVMVFGLAIAASAQKSFDNKKAPPKKPPPKIQPKEKDKKKKDNDKKKKRPFEARLEAKIESILVE